MACLKGGVVANGVVPAPSSCKADTLSARALAALFGG